MSAAMTFKLHSPLSASVQSRIRLALAANAFGQAVTVGSQLLLTPIFFRLWGAEKYGEWLLISSIPAYLAMADLGIGAAAGNDMSIKAGAGDRLGARQTFYNAFCIAVAAAVISVLVGAICSAVIFGYSIPKTTSIDSQTAAIVLMVFAMVVAIGFCGGVISAGYRCCGRNAQGTALANASRLTEATAMGTMLLLGHGPIGVCVAALVVKCSFALSQAILLRLVCPWLFGHRDGIDWQLLRRLIKPSLGFLAFPLGNALALQGPIVILGWAFGGTAVAVYSSLRTLARIPMQFTIAFNASIGPELSLAYGANNIGLLQYIHRRAWTLTLIVSILAAALLLPFGRHLIMFWLGAQGHFDTTLAAVLIVASSTSSIWNVSSVVLTSINAHLRLGAIYVMVNLCCIGSAALLAPSLGWPALFIALITSELALLMWVFPKAILVTCDSYFAFFMAALRFMVFAKPVHERSP